MPGRRQDAHTGCQVSSYELIAERASHLAPLVDVVMRGVQFARVRERMEGLEGLRKTPEDEIHRIAEERSLAEERLVSTSARMEGYRTFPDMLDYLIEAGERRSIKDMLAHYVDVTRWTQDPEDPSTGVVQILLFEQPGPLSTGDGEAEGGLDGALKSVNWRPREDSNP